MKKVVLMLVVMFSAYSYSQEAKPKIEKIGKVIKISYYHENGKLSQTGYKLNGKLHGQWFMYNQEGKKIASGKYDNGERAGKWLFWEGDFLNEVDFEKNRIKSVKKWNKSELVSVN